MTITHSQDVLNSVCVKASHIPQKLVKQEKISSLKVAQIAEEGFFQKTRVEDLWTIRDQIEFGVSSLKMGLTALQLRPFMAYNISLAIDGKTYASIRIKQAKDEEALVQDILEKLSHGHINVTLTPFLPGKQSDTLLGFLKDKCNVSNQSGVYYVSPLIITEKILENGVCYRVYENGIKEEINSDQPDLWEGKRSYPSKVIEEGIFDKSSFAFRKGKRVEDGITYYVNILHDSDFKKSSSLEDPYAIAVITDANGEKHLQFLIRQERSEKNEDIHIACKDPDAAVLAMLSRENYLHYKGLLFSIFTTGLGEALMGGQIHLKTFLQKAMATWKDKNSGLIFSLNPYAVFCLIGLDSKNPSPFDEVNGQMLSTQVFQIMEERGAWKGLKKDLKLFPTSMLSPYDQIRKAIAKDAQLNNSLLIRRLRDFGLDGDEDKVLGCYNFAYCIGNPRLYQVAEIQVLPSEYNLNFLWVNLNPQNREEDIAENIFKDGLDLCENEDCIKNPQQLRLLEQEDFLLEEEKWEMVKTSFTYKISKWADVNPHGKINLWYDSALVTQKAQQKTFDMMRGISQSRGVDLKLRDIRHLPSVTGEIENILHPGVPLYYRVDLIKVLIADYMMSSQESPKYCVVSDIDVEPMTSEHLFDERTLNHLYSKGYVFLQSDHFAALENGFFIFNKEKQDLQKIHHQTMIQSIVEHIQLQRKWKPGMDSVGLAQHSESIFEQYLAFLSAAQEPNDSRGTLLQYPRKVASCPLSQFVDRDRFALSDHKGETFRFIGDENIPYTKNGRNFPSTEEKPIEDLRRWKPEPLPPLDTEAS